MVLISHKYKFIYIKNKKVASTSVESFFQKFCIDPNSKYNISESTDEIISKYGIIGAREGGKFNKWKNHINANDILKEIGNDKFNSYFKFCIVRNPYDKMVSKYFFEKSNMSFKEYCKVNNCNNLNIHTINNKFICNYYIRYENLKDDIIKVCNKLGITDYNINDLPTFKSNIRPSNKHYSEYYDEETKNIVYNNHKLEFEKFNYSF